MCKPASMVLTKTDVYWSKKTDSHIKIIQEFKLHPDGVRGPNIVGVEISPKDGDLSRPLKEWKFTVDQASVDYLPDWWDAQDGERRTRLALKDWAACKLKGWKVKEAFHPVNPLKLKADKSLDKQKLLKEWYSVKKSVWNSVKNSVWNSVGNSVGNSVKNSVGYSVRNSVRYSVRNSVRNSVYGYIGSLFHNIKTWKYTNKKNPWRALRKLWLGGYVPSFDGTTWRLHAGVKAKVVFEISAEELRSK